jgi:hypothetical protein
VNIFEGSRRIALLAGGIAIVVTLIGLGTDDPYVSVSYSISHPNGSFQRMTESCPAASGRHYFTTTSKSGKRVSINLCLLTMPFGDDKQQLVPYKVDEKNMLWGAATYSSEVSEYEETLEARFVLPPEDNDWIENEISTQYWKNWKEGLGYLGIGLAIFAGFVWAVGWIVRGFMGIPRGMDRRPSSEA